MGIVDAVNRQVFSFVLPRIWDDGLMPGNVSFIVQSGMLSAGFLIDTVSHGTMGISKACSIGNKVDINECDILEYLIRDADTEAIAAYLESIADGKRFLDICWKTDKPIVVLKGGKSARGAKAAMSHTSSLAGDHAVISGALAQANVVEANDFKQMIDLARTLSMCRRMKPPAKKRIAVLTYSGSAGIVSADFMARMGLQVADLSSETLEIIQEVFPPWMPPSNPVDLWPAIEKNGPQKVYETTFKAVCSDPNVDAVFFHVFIGGIIKDVGISILADIARKHEKPLFIWLLGGREEAHQFQLQAQDLGVPVYREIHRAIECMAALFKFWECS
jgi:acetyltransferase